MKRIFLKRDDRAKAMLPPGVAEVLETFRLACRTLEEDLNALAPDRVAGQVLISVSPGEVVIAYVGKLGTVSAGAVMGTTMDAVMKLCERANIDPLTPP